MTNVFSHTHLSRFDQAMVAFLDCLQQVRVCNNVHFYNGTSCLFPAQMRGVTLDTWRSKLNSSRACPVCALCAHSPTQFKEHVESQDKHFKLPYRINKDKIGDSNGELCIRSVCMCLLLPSVCVCLLLPSVAWPQRTPGVYLSLRCPGRRQKARATASIVTCSCAAAVCCPHLFCGCA